MRTSGGNECFIAETRAIAEMHARFTVNPGATKDSVPLSPRGRGVWGEGGQQLTRQQDRARQLRRFPTETEAFLWRQLRGRAFKALKFRRQLTLGSYIVAFVCLEKRLIIELDAGQHNAEAQRQYDTVRDQRLRSQGFRILRYWNNEVFDE